jgi:hypothetical protein
MAHVKCQTSQQPSSPSRETSNQSTTSRPPRPWSIGSLVASRRLAAAAPPPRAASAWALAAAARLPTSRPSAPVARPLPASSTSRTESPRSDLRCLRGRSRGGPPHRDCRPVPRRRGSPSSSRGSWASTGSPTCPRLPRASISQEHRRSAVPADGGEGLPWLQAAHRHLPGEVRRRYQRH